MEPVPSAYSAKAVRAFVEQMEADSDFHTPVADAIHFWAAERMLEYLNHCMDHMTGEKKHEEFRRWLREEIPKIERLLRAALKRLK